MFGKLKNLFGGDSGIEITAPVAGKVVALEDVPDPTFAQGILGPGIAIEPAEGRIVAPADGTVDVMFETGHAVSMTTADGADTLIWQNCNSLILCCSLWRLSLFVCLHCTVWLLRGQQTVKSAN